MKVLGFMTIHYGKEYLKESLLSIKNHCEKVVIAYSYSPSHGHNTGNINPDTRDEIYKICIDVLGENLIWDEAQYYTAENQHRGVYRKYSNGYDLVLTIDADEVFKEDELQKALTYAYNNNSRYYGINGYVNFWRSFNWACYDGFRPIRIENLNNNNTLQDLNCPLTIYHFSTAQSEPVMRYKYSVFGHASEIRPNWLDNIYYKWSEYNNFGDVHCVAYGIWNPIKFDKTTLPESLKQHPNYNKELI